MTAWTTFISSSNQAPGRPQKWRESLSHRRSAHVGEQLLRLSDICTVHRTLLRLWLLLVAVSCVRSAPLPLSQNQNQEELQHQHGALSQDVGSMSSLREERAVHSGGRWTNATIPFTFDTSTLSLLQRNRIIKAMKVWQKKTCIRFVERTNEDFFVNIYRHDAACQAEVGMKAFVGLKGRGQPMQLSQTYCLQSKHRGKIVHELGHVIGFYHEHQRTDRDQYVQILWENLIKSDVIHSQYNIITKASDLGTSYDYNSIMHYGPTDNSGNGNITMITLDERFQNKIGQRTRPSMTDYRQANLFYSCEKHMNTSMPESMERPDLLPSSANDIRSGDNITLTPDVNSTKTWWLNCTDGCKLSDAAGKKFGSDDMSDCYELIFELQKVGGMMESTYIKVGDTVALKHRLPDGGANIVSCSSSDGECEYKTDCIIGEGDAGKFDEDLVCPDDVFIVGAVDKTSGEQITHRDRLTLSIIPPASAAEESQKKKSWFDCQVDSSDSGGECSKHDCSVNEVGTDDLISELNECNELFAFLITKL